MSVNIEASEQCVDVASREIGNGNIEKAEKLLTKVKKKLLFNDEIFVLQFSHAILL